VAQAEDTPSAYDIFIENDAPITNPPNHFQDVHLDPLIGALIAFGVPLVRLALSTIRLILPNFLLPKFMKMTTKEANESKSFIQGVNRLVGRIAASHCGTCLAHVRNIGGLIFAGTLLYADPLRVWSCYLPEILIGVGSLTSWGTRWRVWRAIRKLKKAEKSMEDNKARRLTKAEHKKNALGLLPHRIPKPDKKESSNKTQSEGNGA
jgi:hypothetical protein